MILSQSIWRPHFCGFFLMLTQHCIGSNQSWQKAISYYLKGGRNLCVLLPERPFKYLFKLKLLFNIFLLYVESSVMICVLLLKRNTHGSGINVIQYSPEVKRKMSSSGALNHSCAISYSLTLTASFISRCLQSFLPTISSKETVGNYSLTAVL